MGDDLEENWYHMHLDESRAIAYLLVNWNAFELMIEFVNCWLRWLILWCVYVTLVGMNLRCWYWMMWMLRILVNTCMVCYPSFLNVSFILKVSWLILSGLWWCNANPQWFTTYLSVWTGRWSAGCLVVLVDAEEWSSSFSCKCLD
jgi:hypothetical protein